MDRETDVLRKLNGVAVHALGDLCMDRREVAELMERKAEELREAAEKRE